MMDINLNKLLSEIALAGTGYHCNEEVNLILKWLSTQPECEESVALITVMNFMNSGLYELALKSGYDNDKFPSLMLFFAICEWQLGLGEALDLRLAKMQASGDPQLEELVPLLREPGIK